LYNVGQATNIGIVRDCGETRRAGKQPPGKAQKNPHKNAGREF